MKITSLSTTIPLMAQTQDLVVLYTPHRTVKAHTTGQIGQVMDVSGIDFIHIKNEVSM